MPIFPLSKRGITSNKMALGCMGFGGGWNHDPYTSEHILATERAIDAAMESGISMFDHADIYTFGKAERVFGEVLKRRPELREQMVIQSKCGIRFQEGDFPARYDFSKEHIIHSVDGILERLGTEYLDILLLHRPDPLIEPDEVAEAFQQLRASGKVRHFGVSNMNQYQMNFLQKSLEMPLVVNQLEMSLYLTDWLDHGVHVNNHKADSPISFPDGLVEHCRMEDIQIQAWAPLAYGMFSGKELDQPSPSILKTKEVVEKLASDKGVATEAIVLGWLMRHPAGIQPVIGTTNPDRIRHCSDAVRVSEEMTREEWYSLYIASRGKNMP